MKIVLLKDLKGKGKKGDIIEVNNGYANNFLIPNGYALAGTATNLNEAKQAQASNAYKAEQERLKAVEIGEKIKNITVTLPIKCGANGKTFGSVTNKEIAESLTQLGYDIDKKKIMIDTIKQVGTYTATVKLHPTVSVKINISVIAE